MNQAPSEKVHDVTTREIDLSAEARKLWGPKWNAPEISYRFSSGREFTLRTGDAAIYATSPYF